MPPSSLRQYYEHAYGRQRPAQGAFDVADFEQYYALWCIGNPGATRWNAALASKNEEFRALIDSFEADTKPDPSPLGPRLVVRQKAQVDLFAEELAEELDLVLLDRIKNLSGLGRLAAMERLDQITVVKCSDGDADDPLSPPATVGRLSVRDSSLALTYRLLSATEANEVDVTIYDDAVLDLASLRSHHRLTWLSATAPAVTGLRHLENHQLTDLLVTNVTTDDEFRSALVAQQASVRRLWVQNAEPTGPKSFPSFGDFRCLETVRVVGHPDWRDEWIDTAVSHRSIGFQFEPMPEQASKAPSATIEDVYRGAAIYRVQRGKQVSYEVSGNLADELLDSSQSNHELADRLSAAADAASVTVEVFSSGDVLVASTSDADACRWAIDWILNL